MGQFSIGFVYVLINEGMPGVVKIGQTSRLSEDRADDLYRTNVPYPFEVAFRAVTSDPVGLEGEVHRLLEDKRVNRRREFFQITAEEAADTILKARQKVDGIERWAKKKQNLIMRAGDRLLLAMKAGQIFVLSAYPTAFAPEADIVDTWQAHTDGDILELYLVAESEYTAGFSDNDRFGTTDPLPFLNRSGTAVNDVLIGRERLVPGDRLLWIGNNEDDFASVVFEAYSHGQVLARTVSPKFADNGMPLLLPMLTYRQVPTRMVEIGQEFLQLPRPRVWAPRSPNKLGEWSAVDQKEAEDRFWMHQLGKKKKP